MLEPDATAEPAAYAPARQQRRLGGRGTTPVRLGVPVTAELDAAQALARLENLAAHHESLRTTVVVPSGRVDPVQLVGAATVVELRLDEHEGVRTLELACPQGAADLATLGRVAAIVSGAGSDASDPIQFAEYAEWQVELGAEAPEGAALYWAAAQELTWTGLPQVGVPAPQGSPQASSARPVSGAPSTPNGHWLGLLVCALHRLTGEDTITLGVELDARRGDELAGALGPYSEVLPVSVTVETDDTIGAVLSRCADAVTLMEQWQEWAPDALAADPAVLLGLGPATAEVDRPGVELELRLPADASRTAAQDPAVVIGHGSAPAAELTAVLELLAAADPNTPLGEIQVVSGVIAPSRVAPPGPGDPSPLITRIRSYAQQTPSALAVRQGDTAVTYAELVDVVADTVTRLRAVSAAGTPVAVLADRSVGAVLAAVAAIWSGRGYLPLDPAAPTARLHAMLVDSGCEVLLQDAAADGQFAKALGLADDAVLAIALRSGAATTASLPEDPAPDALAYVIYTSGSTGAPKGVEVSTANLDGYLDAVTSALHFEPGWRWAVAGPLSTDLGNTALFGAFATGGSVTVLDNDQVFDPDNFAAVIRDEGIDAVKITPSHLGSLLGAATPALPGRLVVLGGEALPWVLVDRIRELSDVRVANHYGPTETTVGALTHEVSAGEHRTSASVPIGVPLPGVRVGVLTTAGAEVPVGAIGELTIGGIGVARGYRNDPVRTAERFRVTADGAEYRTGDVVRLRPDGEIEFLGRRDGQVKIRGFRVETGEIEAVLLTHPGVQRAAVVLDRTVETPTLAAYLVSHFHPSPTVDELRAHLSARLPEHMVPATFTELDALPLTTNGKLDTRALPEPSRQSGAAYHEPETIIETEIAAIYADLLEHEPIGRTDDFFRLGGHSLLATQAVLKIRQAFAVDLPIHAIFVAPRVADLSDEVERMLLGPAAPDQAGVGGPETHR